MRAACESAAGAARLYLNPLSQEGFDPQRQRGLYPVQRLTQAPEPSDHIGSAACRFRPNLIVAFGGRGSELLSESAIKPGVRAI